MFEKILICTDGSESAIAAARVAAQLAKFHSAELTLLYVCDLPMVDERFPGAPSLARPLLGKYVEDIHSAVVQRTRPVIDAEGVSCHLLLEVGEPIAVIPRIADRCGFDLVVVGSRGLGLDKEMQLGSVSHGVVQRCHCPVLTVR